MINKNIFDTITEKAREYKYSAMAYIDFDDCKNSEVLNESEDFILMQDKSKMPAMLHFAANNFESLIKRIVNIPGKLRLHFVPREFAARLCEIGFVEWAEFADFWNADIVKTVSNFDCECEIEYLRIDECEEAYAVSKRCELQSRGFEGQTVEYFNKWLDENKVIIQRRGSAIAGYCCVSIINNGTTLWIREVAVDPKHQGKGLGKKLVEQAMKYGVENGAVKAFLAADLLNENAIGLYNRYGLFAKDGESELQMIKE